MFSLFPLLKRENQITPYYLTSLLFYLISKTALKLIDISKEGTKKTNDEIKYKNNENLFFYLIEIIIFIIMIFYHFVDYTIPPPEKYPWFYPMLNAAFCFCYFFCIFLYSNYDLMKMAFEKNQNKGKKIKYD